MPAPATALLVALVFGVCALLSFQSNGGGGGVDAAPPRARDDGRVSKELPEDEQEVAKEAFIDYAFLDPHGVQQVLAIVLGKQFSLELIEKEMEAKDVDEPDHRKDIIYESELYRFINHMRDKASDVLTDEEELERANKAFEDYSTVCEETGMHVLDAEGARAALLFVLQLDEEQLSLETVEEAMGEKHDPEHAEHTITLQELYRFVNHMRAELGLEQSEAASGEQEPEEDDEEDEA